MLDYRPAATNLPASADGLTLTELSDWRLFQVSAWTTVGLAVVLEGLIDPPPTVGGVGRRGALTAIRTDPRQVWLLSDAAQPPALAAAGRAAITELSHGRCRIRCVGAQVAKTLARHLPIDLHPQAFAPDRAVQSAIHHVPVLLLRLDVETFDAFVPRGYADSFVSGLTAPPHRKPYAI